MPISPVRVPSIATAAVLITLSGLGKPRPSSQIASRRHLHIPASGCNSTFSIYAHPTLSSDGD